MRRSKKPDTKDGKPGGRAARGERMGRYAPFAAPLWRLALVRLRRMGGKWRMRYLLSYLLLASVLLIVSGLPIYWIIRGMIRDQLVSGAKQSLSMLTDRMDTLCAEMDRITLTLQSDGKMIPVLLEQNGYYAKQTCDELNRIRAANGILSEVAIVYAPRYFSEGGKVYAASGVYTRPVFFEYIYRYDRWSLQEQEASIDTYASGCFRPMESVLLSGTTRRRYMTYVTPLGRTGRNPRGVMLFLIDELALRVWMESACSLSGAAVVMRDAQSNTLTAQGLPEYGAGSDLELPEENRDIRIGDVSYLHLANVSRYNGVRYSLLLPNAAIASAMRVGTGKALGFLLGGLVCAVILSALLTFFIRKPMRRLADVAERLMPPARKAYASEFDMISDTLAYLQCNAQQLRDRLLSQRKDVRAYLLSAFLTNQKCDLHALRQLLAEDGVPTDAGEYGVMALRLDRLPEFVRRFEASERDLILTSLMEDAYQALRAMGFTGVGCEIGEEPVLALLLNHEGLSGESMRRLAVGLLPLATERYWRSLTVGVSRVCRALEECGGAFAEALAQTERRFVSGEGRVYCAADESENDVTSRKWVELENAVTQALRREEYDLCRQEVAEYVDITTRCLQPQQARRAMSILVIAMRQALGTMAPVSRLDWMERLDALLTANPETIAQIRHGIERMLDDLAQQKRMLTASRNVRLIDEAMSYVEEHIANPALNLDQLSAHLGISAGHLSHVFKEQTNMTPAQYLDAQRMKKACILLRQTQMSIPELLEACGYVDKTNFYRKFRRLYAMTPAAYRSAQWNDGAQSDTQ